jgi:hypothetical protein
MQTPSRSIASHFSDMSKKHTPKPFPSILESQKHYSFPQPNGHHHKIKNKNLTSSSRGAWYRIHPFRKHALPKKDDQI